MVFVPTGYYFFGTSVASPLPVSTLIIKSNVTLRGMRSKPANWSPTKWGTFDLQGPVLLPTDTNIPFITLERTTKNAGIEGLTIFYPLQGIVSGSTTIDPQIVEYPECIIMGDLDDSEAGSITNSAHFVRNMLPVNPCTGIYGINHYFTSRDRVENGWFIVRTRLRPSPAPAKTPGTKMKKR